MAVHRSHFTTGKKNAFFLLRILPDLNVVKCAALLFVAECILPKKHADFVEICE